MVNVRYREINYTLAPVVRMYISGSSGSGKTHFAGELLKQLPCKRIYYFHPDFHETKPTNWDETLDTPVVFSSEFPTVNDLCNIPEKSCLVFDDLIQDCVNSKAIDYLFRVLSSKRSLSVIIMSQSYFPKGDFTVSIRNSSNYHVLMPNSDASMTRRIASSLGLKKEIEKATKCNSDKVYSYIFIDRTNQARASKLEVFCDILSRVRIVIRKSMKYYLLAEPDFKQCFTVKDCDLAEYANKKFKDDSEAESSESDSSDSDESNRSSDDSEYSSDDERKEKRRRRERRLIKREIKRALYKR